MYMCVGKCVSTEGTLMNLGNSGFGKWIWISERKDTNKILVASQVPSPASPARV